MADQTGRLSEAEEQLLAYLRQAADAIDPSARTITERWAYSSQYDLLLREGRLFSPAPLPEGVESLHPGFCFTNSSQLADEHPQLQLTYCEGFGAAPIGAGQFLHTPHAWTVSPEGLALDATWPPEPGTAYLGLPFADPGMWPHPLLGRSLLQEPPFFVEVLRSGLPDGMLADLGRPIPRQTKTPCECALEGGLTGKSSVRRHVHQGRSRRAAPGAPHPSPGAHTTRGNQGGHRAGATEPPASRTVPTSHDPCPQ